MFRSKSQAASYRNRTRAVLRVNSEPGTRQPLLLLGFRRRPEWPVLHQKPRRRRAFAALFGLLARLGQQVERAFDAGDHAGGDTCVTRRRLQFVVTEQRLDNSDIGAALEQVG